MKTIDQIFQLLQERGHGSYFGEPVSQLEHALQCAHLAQQEGAAPSLVAAALLHNVGHLLHAEDEHVADSGQDMAHELLGEEWLSAHFGPDVTQPVKLHVAAKRYLCATDPAYLGKLSPASVQSLKLQGGPMTRAEVSSFEANQFAQAGLRLRLWDDAAKDPTLAVAPLTHYRRSLNLFLGHIRFSHSRELAEWPLAKPNFVDTDVLDTLISTFVSLGKGVTKGNADVRSEG